MVCTLLLLILAIVGVMLGIMSGPGDMLTREEIEANIAADSDKEYTYVSTYLERWGFGSFNPKKLRTVEIYFDGWYVYELPETRDLAKETAELFLKYFYDNLGDFEDKDAVTDALVRCYVKATGDPYAAYRTPDEFTEYGDDMSGEFVGIGVTVEHQFKDDMVTVTAAKVIEVMDGGGAKDAGVKIGDLIVEVGGVSVEKLGYYGIVGAIRGEIGSSVTITVLRGTEKIKLTCERRSIVEKTVKYSMLSATDGIGYIQITGFKANTYDQFKVAIDAMRKADVKGIVFDLRGNPGGYLDSICKVIAELVPDGVRISSYKYADGTEEFDLSESYDDRKDGDGYIDVPVAVLCDGNTASAGELFTAAMRDYDAMGVLDAVIIGEKTYGKGVMQSSFEMSDGSYLTFTMAFYNPPSGVNYDGVGISPSSGCALTNPDDDAAAFSKALTEISKLITPSFPDVA